MFAETDVVDVYSFMLLLLNAQKNFDRVVDVYSFKFWTNR